MVLPEMVLPEVVLPEMVLPEMVLPEMVLPEMVLPEMVLLEMDYSGLHKTYCLNHEGALNASRYYTVLYHTTTQTMD